MIELINGFYEKNGKYGYLKDIHITREIFERGCSDFQIKLILTEYPYNKGTDVFEIIFNGVKDIKIGKLEGLLKLVIDIRDLSSSQLEGIKYKIFESENDIFSFNCNDFTYMLKSY